MPANPWKLDKDLADRIAALASDLQAAASDLRDEYDEKPERWQDGDRGTEVGAWIEQVEEMVDTLEALPSEA